MRCPTKYLHGRISNYNNNNGGTAKTDESSDSYISDWNNCIISSGIVGGESEFPGSFDTSGSVRTSNLYLASVRIFPFSSLISHNGNSKFSFFPIVIPFSPERSLTRCPLYKTSFRDIFYFADDTITIMFSPITKEALGVFLYRVG